MRLQDKVVIITGGANGIGKETAILFAKHGAKLILADYEETNGLQTLEELRNIGAEAIFVKADVSKMEDAEKVLDLMKEKTSLRRLGQSADIANAYLFLASDEASFVNGTVLSVDGGLTF